MSTAPAAGRTAYQWLFAAVLVLLGLLVVAALLEALLLPRALVRPTMATIAVLVGVPIIILRVRRRYFG